MSADLPTEVPEIERLQLQLAAERTARLEMVVRSLAAQHAQAMAELNRASQEHATRRAALVEEYALKDGDDVDLETGAILRKPAG